MKDKLLIYTIFLLLIFSISSIFIYGEYLKNKKDYTILSFTNSELTLDSQNIQTDNLAIVVQNFHKKSAAYKITYFIDGQKKEELEKKILADKTEKVAAPEKIVDWIKNGRQQDHFELRIQINDGQQQQEIYKKITLKS